MGKKLTEKERRAREVNKVVLKIKKFEKTHSEEFIKSACAKYNMAIIDRRNAEEDIKDAEKRLADARGRLK